MEEHINQEIRAYREQLFMGLTMRQALGGLAAVILGAVIYLQAAPVVGTSAASVLCVLSAVVPCLLGFYNWRGMPAEQAAALVLRHIMTPRRLVWRSVNHFKPASRRQRRERPGKEEINAENTDPDPGVSQR